MWNAVAILFVATALAGLVKVLSERIGWLKRWSWHIAVFIELIGVVIAGMQLFKREPLPPATKDETAQIVHHAVQETIQPLICKIDSLETLIKLQTSAGLSDTLYRQLAREQAECLAATDVLHTAMDSGLVAIGLGDYDKAITNLNYAILAARDDSSRAKSYFYQAFAFAQWGDSLTAAGNHDSAKTCYEQAILSLDSTLAYKHDKPQAWYNRGNNLRHLERYKEAIVSYDSALAYKHDDPEAWCNRGNALSDLERYQEALASFDSALAYAHDDPEIWFNRGNTLFNLEHYYEALASFDSALTYKHDDPKAWCQRGITLHLLGHYEEAGASFDSALVHKHDLPDAWSLRGLAFCGLSRYQEALASCDSALKYNPYDTNAAKLRNAILEEMKE